MRLPPELLDKIFALASGDGGKTTCALRAASQTFRAINEPYHLKTVLVTSVNSIWALCRTLCSIPEQRRIQTLHVRLEVTSAKPKPLKRWLRHLLPASDNEKPVAPSVLAEHAVTSLCRLCASSLSTLAMMVDGDLGPAFPYLRVFQGTTYPHMQTLIIGSVKFPNGLIYYVGRDSMPRLEQLYLGGCNDFHAWAGVLRDVLGNYSIQHTHVQCRSDRDAFGSRHLLDDPSLRAVLPESSSTSQVLHLWPMDGDAEFWEALMTSFAPVPTAQRRWQVRMFTLLFMIWW
jgi:hypothetical protein